MNKLTKQLLTLCLSSTLLIGVHAKADESKYNIEKLPSASHEIVEKTNDGKILYVADKNELADALTGGVLSITNGGSLLTLDSNNIQETESNLLDKAEKVFVLGGEERIGKSIEERSNFSGRISGADRFETATKVAETLGTDRNIVIVNGMNYVDAITSTPLSIIEGRNILMVTKDGIPEATKVYLEKYGKDRDIIFVGGEDSISSENKQAIYNLTGNTSSVDANTYAGKDRYETSISVAKRTEGKNIVLAHGEDFTMALASVNFTKSHNTMTLLVSPTNAEEVLDGHFGESEKTNIYSIGTEVSLSSEKVETENNEQTENSEKPEETAVEDKKEENNESNKEENKEQPSEENKKDEGTQTDKPSTESKETQTETEVKPEEQPVETKSVQSFIDAALAMKGWDYSQSMRMSDGYADCSSLVLKALIKSGLTEDTTRNLTSETIWGDPRFYQITQDQLKPGDVCYNYGHLAIYMGDNSVFEAKDWGVPAGYGNFQGRFSAFFRIKGL
ncbi:cell wall-binding repeat-containing protein [Microaceticoccus formicicus]|uniref:cell wall-binding repeat-containing protein n=1 Tax=Microaceticoccus formicicus TaxID=3118105 RepID=UPI003CD04F6B|nr:cell wall-binding repeat-containing protein [Peptoniphilaceae bacterium AMB_02]